MENTNNEYKESMIDTIHGVVSVKKWLRKIMIGKQIDVCTIRQSVERGYSGKYMLEVCTNLDELTVYMKEKTTGKWIPLF